MKLLEKLFSVNDLPISIYGNAVDLTITVPFIVTLLSVTSQNFNVCKIVWQG